MPEKRPSFGSTKKQDRQSSNEATKERITNQNGQIDDGDTTPMSQEPTRRGALEGTREDSPSPPQTVAP